MAEPLRRERFIEAPPSEPRLSMRARSPAYQAYLILYVGFIVAPLIAGADKFFHLLVNWDQYLPPAPLPRWCRSRLTMARSGA